MDFSTTGHVLVYGAMASSAVATGSSVIALRRKDQRGAAAATRALVSAAVLILVGTVLLVVAMYRRDFSLGYVATHVSRSTSPLYSLTALWSGMEGSLLFWTLTTSIYCATAAWIQGRRRPDLSPIATAVFGAILVFFTCVLAFGADPFATISPVPTDGTGLNPLLQSPFMAIHPVMLYLGLTGFIVPFGFAVASLVSGRLDVGWFTSTRRWTIVAWSFLTVGIILGGAWAYNELGWGGYWAWDPVENASLLPWLTGTAFLHSVMIQERRGMLKIWNVALVLGTYALAIFGTFLTRSGLLSSVHTFSDSPVGKAFLPLLAVILIGAFALLGWRYEKLRSKRHIDSLMSREAMFLFNNLFFVAIAFTVLWGTIYPILIEAIKHTKIAVGPPFFNSVIIPIGIALLALTGIGPLVAWRRASIANIRRHFLLPSLGGAAAISALAIAGVRSVGALLALSLCVFVLIATVGEFIEGASAHSSGGVAGFLVGLRRVVGRNRRRYGGYIVHLGVVLIFIGLSGNAFKQSWTGEVKRGETFTIGGYSIRYTKFDNYRTSEKIVNVTVMDVYRQGLPLTTLTPQRNFHIAQRQPQSEIGLHSSLSEDLYLVLTRLDTDGTATVRAWINPLVAWVWIGGMLMALGMIVIISAKPPTLPTETSLGASEHSLPGIPRPKVHA
ncbi:MAG: heme lyase CcmF/NrfE family subunit [Actinomycetota bacterium]|nr:heme lyase CcmF/NrfE family subunit [Actinomycetota bacterium]